MADPSSIDSEQVAAVMAAPLSFITALVGAWAVTTTVTWVLLTLGKKDQIDTLNERIRHRDDRIATLEQDATKREERGKALEADVATLTRERDQAQSERDELKKLPKSIPTEFVDPPKHSQAINFYGGEPEPAPAKKTGAVPYETKLIRIRDPHPKQGGGYEAKLIKLRGPRHLTDEQRAVLGGFLNGVAGDVKIVTDRNVEDAEQFKAEFVDLFERSGWKVTTNSTIGAQPLRGGLGLCLDEDGDFIPGEFAIVLGEAGIPYEPIRAFHDGDIEIRITQVAG